MNTPRPPHLRCHICGAPKTRGPKTDPVCNKHYVTKAKRAAEHKRLKGEILALRDVPWFAARWGRGDLTNQELTETVDILLLGPHTIALAWRVWTVQLSIFSETGTGDIAEMIGVDRRTVWKWTKEYREKGLGALLEKSSSRTPS